MKPIKNIITTGSLLLLAFSVHASSGYFDIFDSGWETLSDDRGIASGHGGQSYDTEYLFLRYNDNDTLSIGLQTGFDIIDGKWNGSNTYGGDIGLSFRDENGDLIGGQANTKGKFGNTNYAGTTDYNYAVDFGYFKSGTAYATKNGDGTLIGENDNGIDAAGLYKVTEWNNKTSHFNIDDGGVFAMDAGTLAGNFSQNENNGSYSDYVDGQRSFFRIVTFDLNSITNLSSNFTVDAFWTMSCGNDQINGSSSVIARNTNSNPVPEPSIVALMAIGSLSIFASGIRRKKQTK